VWCAAGQVAGGRYVFSVTVDSGNALATAQASDRCRLTARKEQWGVFWNKGLGDSSADDDDEEEDDNHREEEEKGGLRSETSTGTEVGGPFAG
jgi:hypothetical protein